MAWVLDLDGVVWLAETPIPGSADAIARLREAGERVVFMTNNYVAKLGRMEIPAERADVTTSAQAAAAMLEPGTTALVCGGPGVTEALQERGVGTIREGDADAVVVGWHKDFDYTRLDAAFTAVRRGARLIGTNDDPTYPTPDGPLPGGGALLAAVAYAAGVTPEVAGKPNPPIVELLAARVPNSEIVVGDRLTTDGALAERLGCRFGLVLTGVTTSVQSEAYMTPERTKVEVADDLAALVNAALGGQ
jgi:HAD superfamily hydrolase (TIGR01450 family)